MEKLFILLLLLRFAINSIDLETAAIQMTKLTSFIRSFFKTIPCVYKEQFVYIIHTVHTVPPVGRLIICTYISVFFSLHSSSFTVI